jgi:queuine tRNA-ribosyltransferase
MVLDECIETPALRDIAQAAVKANHRLGKTRARIFSANGAAQRRTVAMAIWNRAGRDVCRLAARKRAAILEIDFSGYAVGGLRSASRTHVTCEMTRGRLRILPKEKPRYLMGVGRPNN